jgi:hypothetical protein
MTQPEAKPSTERKGRLVSFLKKFNKISAAIFATAGIILESTALLGLAVIDIGQSYLLNRYEKWRDRRKAHKNIGSLAVAGAK